MLTMGRAHISVMSVHNVNAYCMKVTSYTASLDVHVQNTMAAVQGGCASAILHPCELTL